MPTSETRAGAPAPRATPLLDALAAAQDAFARLLADADPGAPVPACAPWTVTELGLHLAGVHRWAAGMARGVDDEGDEPTGAAREPAAVRASYREQAAALLDTLRALPADAPALTLDGPGVAAFWHRRQLHETLVHLHDLAGAAGVPHPLDDPALWADTVDEVVTVMTPRQVRLGRMPALDAPVALVAVDAGRSWVLGGAAGAAGAADAADAPSPAPVTLAGPARVLALLLWGRTTADDPALTVGGDRAALDEALARPLTP
ncbi:MAG: maleylpyruvate isomerase family mycothiol-dependent enzyme [Micrococcales bacterium]|nr:maleylpyruvate isomerase family mycothiol-dependent enzyme [Micrococcales bacterium]